ncbi:MAG: hypothetical protein LBM69_02635, partial [Lachnospiraceae bacterium]|nr:hypothetical protein [Lachnospiraceae bacterium]
MSVKKRSIRQKMQVIVMMISLVALLLAAMIGIGSMLRIQSDVISGSEALGEHAAQKSEDALTQQMEKSLLDIVGGKAELADAKLEMFLGYIDMFAEYAWLLYKNPELFVLSEVAPPNKDLAGQLSMQRYLQDESISLEAVLPKINLLSNLVHVFDPVINDNREIITTIYVGTEQGFLLSYDDRADLGDTESDEEYYDFSESDWYLLAKETGKPVFTDTYLDSYGRGLTISCAAPFYQDDIFAGVVCMDILVDDINNSIIDVNIGNHSYAFLVNTYGDVIASPNQDPGSDQYVNILDDTSDSAYEVSGEIMSGKTGV